MVRTPTEGHRMNNNPADKIISGRSVALAMIIIHMFNQNFSLTAFDRDSQSAKRSTPFFRLTSGSAMMTRILRSDAVVKLAKRLLRTYSPGLLSGSTLMGIMAGGPFAPWGQQTGGTGGLLYPFPTGEATGAAGKKKKRERKKNKMEKSSGKANTDKSHTGQAEPQTNQPILNYWEVSKHGHKVPNMLNIPQRDCPKGTSLPWVCSFFPTATLSRACRNENTTAASGCSSFVAEMSLTVRGSKTQNHVDGVCIAWLVWS